MKCPFPARFQHSKLLTLKLQAKSKLIRGLFQIIAKKVTSHQIKDRLKRTYSIIENELSNDLTEYLMYCEAIQDLITRYEIVQCRQDGHTSKKRALEKEKYELESGGGKSFSAKGLKRAILGGGEHQRLQRIAELEVRIKDLESDVKKLESTTGSILKI